MGVLDIGFDPGSERSSCCTCALCILTIKQHHKSETTQLQQQPQYHLQSTKRKKINRGLVTSADLGIEGGLVPVEQLFHTLANLRGDVPGLKCSYVLPHTTLSQKATDKKVKKQTKKKQSERGLDMSRWQIKQWQRETQKRRVWESLTLHVSAIKQSKEVIIRERDRRKWHFILKIRKLMIIQALNLQTYKHTRRVTHSLCYLCGAQSDARSHN